MGPKASPGRWLIIHGIHDGSMLDRDSKQYERNSEEEARLAFQAAKQQYTALGRKTWFADMYDDQGNKTTLEGGQPYRR